MWKSLLARQTFLELCHLILVTQLNALLWSHHCRVLRAMLASIHHSSKSNCYSTVCSTFGFIVTAEQLTKQNVRRATFIWFISKLILLTSGLHYNAPVYIMHNNIRLSPCIHTLNTNIHTYIYIHSSIDNKQLAQWLVSDYCQICHPIWYSVYTTVWTMFC